MSRLEQEAQCPSWNPRQPRYCPTVASRSKATTGRLPAPTLGAFLSDTAKRDGQLPALVTKPAFRILVTSYAREQTALRIARYLQETIVAR